MLHLFHFTCTVSLIYKLAVRSVRSRDLCTSFFFAHVRIRSEVIGLHTRFDSVSSKQFGRITWPRPSGSPMIYPI